MFFLTISAKIPVPLADCCTYRHRSKRNQLISSKFAFYFWLTFCSACVWTKRRGTMRLNGDSLTTNRETESPDGAQWKCPWVELPLVCGCDPSVCCGCDPSAALIVECERWHCNGPNALYSRIRETPGNLTQEAQLHTAHVSFHQSPSLSATLVTYTAKVRRTLYTTVRLHNLFLSCYHCLRIFSTNKAYTGVFTVSSFMSFQSHNYF